MKRLKDIVDNDGPCILESLDLESLNDEDDYMEPSLGEMILFYYMKFGAENAVKFTRLYIDKFEID